MKKILSVLAAASVLTFGGAAYADNLMDDTFGNTVTIADAEGNVLVSYFFNEDGTFSMAGADGSSVEGTWTLDGDNMCFTAGEQESCQEIDDRAVGESWTETQEDGSSITISIVEGRG